MTSRRRASKHEAGQASADLVSGRRSQLELVLPAGDRPTDGRPAPDVFVRLAPANPTKVYDTFWRFAAERQAIFFRRLKGEPMPWTADPILARYKFTNAYRASDRVSQYLIRRVIYRGDPSPDEVFFRTLLFKLFNRIETWELLEGVFRAITHAEYRFEHYDRLLTRALAEGKRIYSAAYIMPFGGHHRTAGWRPDEQMRKHRHHLRLLEQMMAEAVPARLAEARSMRAAFEVLRSYPMIGDFLAYQYITDVNYSTITDFSEMEFVIPGPGARDGIRKCFQSLGGLSEIDIIKLIADRQQAEFDRLGLAFRSLWGRPLQLIDCQNLFCEIDKYARLYHPDVPSRSGRMRIKQRYRPAPGPLSYWYPPKWNLNERIGEGAAPPEPLRGHSP